MTQTLFVPTAQFVPVRMDMSTKLVSVGSKVSWLVGCVEA